MTIEDAIINRKSVRTFNTQISLTENQIDEIKNAIANATSPFGNEFTIFLKKFDLKGPQKPGTYGTISGAEWYLLLGISDSSPFAPLSAGFAMEQVILKATELGLGTCWIALTFNKEAFAHSTDFPEGESLKIISPIGFPAKHRRLLESLTRVSLGSSNRLSFDKLFFNNNFEEPVKESNVYYNALQMMRLAPSAKNSQPWRALIKGNDIYFYYINKSESSLLDLGIALCHFDLTLKSEGKSGEWILTENTPVHKNYIPVVKYSLKI